MNDFWVIKDNYGRYAYQESFRLFREGVPGYISYHVIPNGVYIGSITKERALKVLEMLNEDKVKYGFPEIEFHIEETTLKKLIEEIDNFSGKRRAVELERECVAVC